MLSAGRLRVRVTDLDTILWLMGIAGQIVLLGTLLFRRLYRTFPLFSAFILWNALSDLFQLAVLMGHHDANSTIYYRTCFAINIVQYALEIGVFVEIATNVLKPVRRSLPQGIIYILFVLMGVIAVAGFLFAARLNASTLANPRAFIVVDATVAILQVLTFLLIAAFSQVLGLTWRHHVLQLASGLAFYAAITLIVGLAHSYLRAGPEYATKYREIAHFGVAGYLCSLSYWCYSFARKEAPRKEFSPQMAQLLVSIGGSAKRHSVAARSLDIKRP
jgi:hypothetical protein